MTIRHLGDQMKYKNIADIGHCRDCGEEYAFVAPFLCKSDKIPRLAAFCSNYHQRQISRIPEHLALINHPEIKSTYFTYGTAARDGHPQGVLTPSISSATASEFISLGD